eukprot:Em0140g4a
METVEKGAKDFKEEHQDSKRQETETAAINVVRKPVPNRACPSGREEGCTRCAGNGHNSWNCPYRGTQCHKCKRVGHLARACRSSGSKKETTHRVTEPQEQEYRLDYIGVLKGINTKRVWIEVELNGIPLKMELDTGASGQSPPTGARGNPTALDELLKRYDVIFKQQLGKIKDLKATIRVQSEATPAPDPGICYGGAVYQRGGNVCERRRGVQSAYDGGGAVGKSHSVLEHKEHHGKRVHSAPALSCSTASLTFVRTTELSGLLTKSGLTLASRSNSLRKLPLLEDSSCPLKARPPAAKIATACSIIFKYSLVDFFSRATLAACIPLQLCGQVSLHVSLNCLSTSALLKIAVSTLNSLIVPLGIEDPTWIAEQGICFLGPLKPAIGLKPTLLDSFLSTSTPILFSGISILENAKAGPDGNHCANACHPCVEYVGSLLQDPMQPLKPGSRYKRLPIGVSSAPALFQRAMDTILQGLPGVVCYQDDILVTGKEIDEHLKNLERVFGRLKEFGLRLRLTKCKFLKESVEYLGHVISRNGICTSPKKIEVIQKAPIPLNVTELRSFLGIVNYYGKFIQSVADLCAPLNELLQKNTPWIWTATCMESFNQLKQALGSAEVLCHYNPSEEISLACDASAHGLGAVLSHHFKDGSERPISYASRTLSKAERNYSQIEKEALSIIFGLKKFHQYLYGRKFLLVTDHQPLVKIFGPKTGISSVVAGRLQRWALCLAGYQYDIVYKPTQKHGNADGLSRYPSTESEAIDGEEGGDRILALYGPQLAACPLTVKDIERGTMSDALLRQVLKFTKDGWNKAGRVDDQLRPYFNRREELSTEGNCLMWGIKAVIPPGMRQS